MVGREPALVHRRGGQGWEADDVADGIDVIDLGLEVVVDEYPAPVVGLEACVGQIEVVGLALPPRGVHHGFGGDLFAAGQRRDGARGPDVDRGDFFAEPERDREVAQVEFQRLDDLGIAELEHVGAFLHHRDLGAQGREHRGVLDTDHPGPDHHHRGRQDLQIEDSVGVEDSFLVELDSGRAGGFGAGGDDDVLRCDGRAFPAVRFLDQHRVRVQKPAVTLDQVDAVADQLGAHDVDFLADDVRGAGQQVRRGDLVLDAVARAVQFTLVHPRQVDDGLAQGLRRDGAGVDADAAQHPPAFDHGHRLAELGGGDGGLLAARSRTDHDEVVLQHRSHG